jgi:hypothetical protein
MRGENLRHPDRVTGGRRSGETRRANAERRALSTWLSIVKEARTDHDVCMLLAAAVETGIRIGYERAYNRFRRAA